MILRCVLSLIIVCFANSSRVYSADTENRIITRALRKKIDADYNATHAPIKVAPLATNPTEQKTVDLAKRERATAHCTAPSPTKASATQPLPTPALPQLLNLAQCEAMSDAHKRRILPTDKKLLALMRAIATLQNKFPEPVTKNKYIKDLLHVQLILFIYAYINIDITDARPDISQITPEISTHDYLTNLIDHFFRFSSEDSPWSEWYCLFVMGIMVNLVESVEYLPPLVPLEVTKLPQYSSITTVSQEELSIVHAITPPEMALKALVDECLASANLYELRSNNTPEKFKNIITEHPAALEHMLILLSKYLHKLLPLLTTIPTSTQRFIDTIETYMPAFNAEFIAPTTLRLLKEILTKLCSLTLPQPGTAPFEPEEAFMSFLRPIEVWRSQINTKHKPVLEIQDIPLEVASVVPPTIKVGT